VNARQVLLKLNLVAIAELKLRYALQVVRGGIGRRARVKVFALQEQLNPAGIAGLRPAHRPASGKLVTINLRMVSFVPLILIVAQGHVVIVEILVPICVNILQAIVKLHAFNV